MRRASSLFFLVATLVTSLLGLGAAGCESCEFTFGPGVAHIVVTPDVTAVNLRVQVCDQTEETNATSCTDLPPCDDPNALQVCSISAPDVAAGSVLFAAELRYTGTFSCTAGPYVVKVSADNCDPVNDVEPEGDQFTRVDVALHCH
ncbi:Hypothetical protein A7982_10734 [Minicystis rosea]|nr:Hypothetical protein A7982_10734 [Minicystis rosea]